MPLISHSSAYANSLHYLGTPTPTPPKPATSRAAEPPQASAQVSLLTLKGGNLIDVGGPSAKLLSTQKQPLVSPADLANRAGTGASSDKQADVTDEASLYTQIAAIRRNEETSAAASQASTIQVFDISGSNVASGNKLDLKQQNSIARLDFGPGFFERNMATLLALA